MRKEIAVGICFCLAGILCACLFGSEYFAAYGFLNEYHLKSFAEGGQEISLLLWNILWERGKFFVLVGLISATSLKKFLPLIMQCLLCFTAGIYLSACIMNMGISGILFFLASLFPQGLLYLLALVLILRREPAFHRYHQKNALLRKGLFSAGVMILVFVGCLLEAFLGTKLLRWAICTIFNL